MYNLIKLFNLLNLLNLLNALRVNKFNKLITLDTHGLGSLDPGSQDLKTHKKHKQPLTTIKH